MKNVLLLLALSCTVPNVLFAQGLPDGINYQAVARNLKGEVLANQPIALKVVLFSVDNNVKTSYFTETHDVTSSPSGVFSLVIGKGQSGAYKLTDVPWSKENIWMEVSIKSKGEREFATISNSKLLAVPYAYHALTANNLVSQESARGGIPSQTWSLFGNSKSNPVTDMLGTTDYVDLKMVTNEEERLRILANGNIDIKRSLGIGANLTVDSSVYLNQVSGSTINYGPFTVERLSPTLLSGTLTVDKATDLNSSLNVDGITDLNSNLNVNNASPTKLTGTLRVDGITDLNNDLNVNNVKPTVLTGTLQVDKDAVFHEKVWLDNAAHQSTTTTNGALVVDGGFGLGGNLNVGGEAKFGGPVEFGAAVSITDPTPSTSTTTGALKVTGGVGIGKQLNVGEASTFGQTLGIAGITTISNTTQSTTAATGALVVNGGAGIAANVFVGGTLTSTGAAQINNTLNVNGPGNLPGGYIANFVNTSTANGINIQVNSALPSNDNNFITFKDNTGHVRGTIEGEIESNLTSNGDYQDAITFKSITAGLATADLAIAIAEQFQGGIKVVAAATSTTPCVGLGVCFTAPVPSLIIESASNLILKIANFVVKTANLATLYADLGVTVQHKKDRLGITLTSGSGDYAEWLEKKNFSETFTAGDVVSLKNGKITKELEEGGKMMVISLKPIVLGNNPDKGKESNYEKVAFMGQVPVKVLGKVNAGDYLLPSGFNKGFAKAVAPDKMNIDDYNKIVGVAWEGANYSSFGFVNTAVGLNVNDYGNVIKTQEKKIKEQASELELVKNTLAKTHNALDRLIPGFASAMGHKEVMHEDDVVPVQQRTAVNKLEHKTAADAIVPDASNIVYFQLSQQQINDAFKMAESVFQKTGQKAEDHPFWGKIKSDPSFKSSIVRKVNEQFEFAIHEHKEINRIQR